MTVRGVAERTENFSVEETHRPAKLGRAPSGWMAKGRRAPLRNDSLADNLARHTALIDDNALIDGIQLAERFRHE